MAEDDGQKRRRVLQNMGIGSVVSLSGIPVAGAAKNGKEQELVGISYDTLTHGTGAEITGQVSSQTQSNGAIDIAGYDIPFGKLKKKSEKSGGIESHYVGVLDDEEFVIEDEKGEKIQLKVKIYDNEDGISGILSRPSGEFGRLGFYLISPNELSKGRELMEPNTASEWKDHPLEFEVPSKGLPTDSSATRLVKHKKSQRESERRKGEIESDVSTASTSADSADSGVVTEVSHEATLDGYCDESDYQINFGVLSDIKEYHEYNEIEEGGSNRWRFYVYFGDRPTDVFGCDNNSYIKPENYSLRVEPFYDEQQDYIHFSHPQPADGDGESDNEELGLALDVISEVGGKIGGVGVSLAEYVMSGSGASTTVDYYDSGSIYDFDIDLGGSYSDLPRELSDKAQTTQVSLRVNNEWPSDEMMCSIEFQPEYTFRYADHRVCGNCQSVSPTIMFKTITPDWATNPEAWYDSVDNV